MACLDTSLLIDVLAAEADARGVMDDLDDRGDRHGIAAVTAVELWIGASQGSAQEYRRTEDLLDTLLWFDLDRATARRAGELQGQLRAAGSPLGFNDCVIAATAIEHDQELVTADADFERVDGLRVRTY